MYIDWSVRKQNGTQAALTNNAVRANRHVSLSLI